MFAVRPLVDKELQRELCESLETEYYEDSMAFFAAELSDDREHIKEIIGISQFTVTEPGEILTLKCADGKENDEAMIIMCRAVMNFMWRASVKNMKMKSSAGPEAVLVSCGLPRTDEGYGVDLDKFYASPCHFDANKEN